MQSCSVFIKTTCTVILGAESIKTLDRVHGKTEACEAITSGKNKREKKRGRGKGRGRERERGRHRDREIKKAREKESKEADMKAKNDKAGSKPLTEKT